MVSEPSSIDLINEFTTHVRGRAEMFRSNVHLGARQYAAAALFRGCDQLEAGGILTATHGDVVGVIARSAWESWLMGTFLLMGGPEAFARAQAEQLRQERNIVEKAGWLVGDALDEAHASLMSFKERLLESGEAHSLAKNGDWPGLKVEMMAREVAVLIQARTGEASDVIGTYDRLYRGHSAYDTHGVRALDRHVDFDQEDQMLVMCEPTPWIAPASALLAGAIHLCQLAIWVAEDFGQSVDQLQRICDSLLHEAQQKLAAAMAAAPAEVLAAMPPGQSV